MGYWLAPGVHAVHVESDLVFLDIASDAYLCLVGGAAHLHVGADGAVSADPASSAQDLVEAGLVGLQPRAGSGPSPPPVRQALEITSKPCSPLALIGLLPGMAGAAAINLRAARAVQTLTFAQVLALAGPLKAAAFAAPSPALLAACRRFDRLAPWLPRSGRCLMRSLEQRLYLARRGFAVAWVFGVRTWPFEAHCWLQAGEVVLDDSLGHARGFTPILVV
ncbi:hypothetical protein ASD21_15875 [Caulobacter sp. Root1455]|uniref:lasso peptide biosynthesis B2 protein n=1 Tax=unclassified Caulobacter TaxID=2648921 RepID=UPI000701B594|nr:MULTISPECIES: lasso peptide biosynthesis B2 protein [unclassified Caulobacter]KQY28326.1 hypothetical protein ASD38_16735 [Caulobacter sp. Root487D2Y]KQY91787.1 hypothetical protein ASD21_15875 [Caulobacter sp. Root1455]